MSDVTCGMYAACGRKHAGLQEKTAGKRVHAHPLCQEAHTLYPVSNPEPNSAPRSKPVVPSDRRIGITRTLEPITYTRLGSPLLDLSHNLRNIFGRAVGLPG